MLFQSTFLINAHSIRVVAEWDHFWFSLKDVCDALSLRSGKGLIANLTGLSEEHFWTIRKEELPSCADGTVPSRGFVAISLPGLLKMFELTYHSYDFKRLLFTEVLPALWETLDRIDDAINSVYEAPAHATPIMADIEDRQSYIDALEALIVSEKTKAAAKARPTGSAPTHTGNMTYSCD